MAAPTMPSLCVEKTPVAAFTEREAGQVVINLLLIFVGAALWCIKAPKADDLIPFATGVLARSMIWRQHQPQQ
jgi:hypothetical protein